MKSITTAMDTHLALDLTTLASCWKVTRTDGVVFGFTDHDKDLTISGIIYQASSGFFRSAIANSSTTAVDNLEVKGFLDNDLISEPDLRNGAYDYASVEIFTVNWADLTMGIIRMRYGIFGEVQLYPSGLFVVDLRGLTQLFAQTIGEVYAPECRADLGDVRCKIELIPPTRRSLQAYTTGERVLISQDLAEHNVHLDVLNNSFEVIGNDVTTGWTRAEGTAAMFTTGLYGVLPFTETGFNQNFLAPFSTTGTISVVTSTMPPFIFPLNGLWQLMSLRFKQWNVESGWEANGRIEFLNSSNVVLGSVETGFAAVTTGSWVERETALLHVPIGTTKYKVIFEWQNSGGDSQYPLVLLDDPRAFYHEGDPADSPPEDSPTTFHSAEIIVNNHFNSSGGEVAFWSAIVSNGAVEGGSPLIKRRGANTDLSAQVGDYYGRPEDFALPAGGFISRHFIPLVQGPVEDSAIDAKGYDIILSVLTAGEQFGWETSIGVKFYNASKQYIPDVDLFSGLQSNRPAAQWKQRIERDSVPVGARYCKVFFGWDRDTEQTALRPMACYDDVQLDIVQKTYTTDDLRRFGSVEFECTTAGTTDADPPDVTGVVAGNTVADGTVVWTVRVPLYTWTGTVDVDTVNTPFSFRLSSNIDVATAAFFDRGVITFYTGPNAHRSVEIDSFDNTTKMITLEFPLLYAPEDGDSFSMHAGCDLSREICFSKFNNILNFRGEPDIPGTEQYFQVGGM